MTDAGPVNADETDRDTDPRSPEPTAAPPMRPGAHAGSAPGWTFLTNHAHVLIALARDPGVRLRDVAVLVGITERSVQSIVADLESAGYLRRVRVGRRNRYEVDPTGPLRHPAERDHAVGELLQVFTADTAEH